MDSNRLVSFLLRAGIAAAFLYAAIASFIDPVAWIGFLPAFLRKIFPAEILLILFSAYEILISLWLLSCRKIYFAALLSAATMAGIIIFNLNQLDIVFRDLPILFASLALAVLHKKNP